MVQTEGSFASNNAMLNQIKGTEQPMRQSADIRGVGGPPMTSFQRRQLERAQSGNNNENLSIEDRLNRLKQIHTQNRPPSGIRQQFQ